MDALKWLLKASFVIALMFLGLKAEPNNDGADRGDNSASAFSRLF